MAGVLLGGALATSSTAIAGQNAGATARLSWDPDRNMPTLERVDSDRLILYCTLSNAPDVRGIAASLRWIAATSPGCYQLTSTPDAVQAGRVVLEPPPEHPFGGDYQQRIEFRPGEPRTEFAFAIEVSRCEEVGAATFFLRSVRVVDSQGGIDDLYIVGAAHVLGGRNPLPVYEPPPHLLLDGQLKDLNDNWSLRFGTPRVVHVALGAPGPALEAALTVLGQLANQLRVDVQRLRLQRIQRSYHSTHVFFQQTSPSVGVFPGGISVHFDAHGRAAQITNTIIPDVADLGAPVISAEEAQSIARNELGFVLPDPSDAAALVAYAVGAQPLLAWEVTTREWLVFVDARAGSVLAVKNQALAYRDGVGQVWLVNPLVALNDSTLTSMGDACYPRIEEAYREVTLRDLTVGADSLYHLRGPRAWVITTVTPIDSVTSPDGRFIFPRCDPDVTTKGFEQVMCYHYVDRAQAYVQQTLGWSNPPLNGQPKINPWRGTAAYYPPPIDEIHISGFGDYDSGEDAELFLHEWEHSVRFASCESVVNTENEERALAEGSADAVAAILFAHEPGPFDTRWAEWGLRESFPGRRVDRAKRYPVDLGRYQHLNGEIWSAALWDIFRGLEATFGTCATGTPQDPMRSCVACDRVVDGLIFAYHLYCGSGLLTFHNVALAMLERESGRENPRLNEMVDALDRRGHFFSEHEPPFGVEMRALSVPFDQAVARPETVRIRAVNDSAGVVPGSVKLHYGVNGNFSHTVVMGDSAGVYFTATIQPEPGWSEVFVTYYVEATNQDFRVTAHWPKSSPELGAAFYYVGTDREGRVEAFPGVPDEVPGNGIREYILAAPGSGTVTDVNVRLAMDGESLGKVRAELIDDVTDTTLVTLMEDSAKGYLSSLPDSLDWWFDDETDAPFNHIRPYTRAEVDRQLAEFDGLPLGALVWKLRITNENTTSIVR